MKVAYASQGAAMDESGLVDTNTSVRARIATRSELRLDAKGDETPRFRKGSKECLLTRVRFTFDGDHLAMCHGNNIRCKCRQKNLRSHTVLAAFRIRDESAKRLEGISFPEPDPI